MCSECFFVVKGSIMAISPQRFTHTFSNSADLIKFCAEHYKEIIWEKMPDGLKLRERTQEHIIANSHHDHHTLIQKSNMSL